MTNKELSTIYAFMGRVRLNKVSDRKVADAILSNHLAMHEAMESTSRAVAELKHRVFGEKEADLEAYNKTVAKMSASTDEAEIKALSEGIDPEMRELVGVFNDAFLRLMEKPVEVDVERIPRKDFLAMAREQDLEITLADLIGMKEILT